MNRLPLISNAARRALAPVSPLLRIDHNDSTLKDLRRMIRRRAITPFIGAGISVPCGMPTWKELITALAKELADPQDALSRVLENDLEGAALSILGALGQRGFELALSRIIPDTFVLRGAVLELPRIWPAGPIVTTNFDVILEACYSRSRVPFQRIINGPLEGSVRSLGTGDHVLIKLHGDRRERFGRVLTKEDYRQAYDELGIPSVGLLPLPIVLASLLKKSMLFLGCSLTTDKAVEVLRGMARSPEVPEHFAILPMPNNDADFRRRREALTVLGIRPIWYPDGAHHYVRRILISLPSQRSALPLVESFAVTLGAAAVASVISADLGARFPYSEDVCAFLDRRELSIARRHHQPAQLGASRNNIRSQLLPLILSRRKALNHLFNSGEAQPQVDAWTTAGVLTAIAGLPSPEEQHLIQLREGFDAMFLCGDLGSIREARTLLLCENGRPKGWLDDERANVLRTHTVTWMLLALAEIQSSAHAQAWERELGSYAATLDVIAMNASDGRGALWRSFIGQSNSTSYSTYATAVASIARLVALERHDLAPSARQLANEQLRTALAWFGESLHNADAKGWSGRTTPNEPPAIGLTLQVLYVFARWHLATGEPLPTDVVQCALHAIDRIETIDGTTHDEFSDEQFEVETVHGHKKFERDVVQYLTCPWALAFVGVLRDHEALRSLFSVSDVRCRRLEHSILSLIERSMRPSQEVMYTYMWTESLVVLNLLD